MSVETGKAAINELTVLLDHVLEEHGFGWDHWMSLLWNLHNVRADDWDALPVGGGRTIRQLVLHIGSGFFTYESSILGDGSREWGDQTVDGVDPGTTPEEVERWLRVAHGKLKEGVASLRDDQLSEIRKAPWGDEYELRRLIELQIQHVLYHVGEINHIRAMLQCNDDWDHQDMGREVA